MNLVWQAALLFSLNLIDAILTIVWVRTGVAHESNQLIASLLERGDLPFLAVKLLMGSIVVLVILSWRERRMARYGLAVALMVYFGLMGVHLFTGLYASGLLSEPFSLWPFAAVHVGASAG
jgi:hypothetical protein